MLAVVIVNLLLDEFSLDQVVDGDTPVDQVLPCGKKLAVDPHCRDLQFGERYLACSEVVKLKVINLWQDIAQFVDRFRF